MPKLRTMPWALLLGAVLLASCGGNDPGSTVEQTLDALAEGDGETVCDNIAGNAEAKMEAILVLVLAHPDAAERIGNLPQGDDEERCAYMAGRIGRGFPRLPRLRKAEVDDVDVAGDTATVDIGDGRFALEERNDEWKLADWGPLAGSEDEADELSAEEEPPGPPPEGEYLECIDPVSYEYTC